MNDSEFLLPSTRPGCRRCELELTTVRRYLDGLSYENVNDLEVRATLRAARGFCAHHAWQFLDITHDSLGAAIIYRDVLGAVLEELGQLAGGDPHPRIPRRFLHESLPLDRTVGQAVRRLQPRTLCPACRALGISLAERGHGTAYLCLPHLRAVVTSGSLGGADLSATWAAMLRRLRRLCSGGKPDAGRRQSRWSAPEPRGSLLDLAEATFGKRGVTRVPRMTRTVVAEPAQSASASIAAPASVATTGTCAVCGLVSREVTEVLTASGQTFPQRLAALIEADDLCNVHAWLALELAGGEAEARRRPLSPAYIGLLDRGGRLATPTTRCRACVLQVRREADYCAGLSGLSGTGTSDAAWTNQGPLCLPHLLRAIEVVSGDRALALVRGNVNALRQLWQDLAEFIRKHDYRFRDEPAGSEQSAPLRALELIAGTRWLA